mgnify:FL=1
MRCCARSSSAADNECFIVFSGAKYDRCVPGESGSLDKNSTGLKVSYSVFLFLFLTHIPTQNRKKRMKSMDLTSVESPCFHMQYC